MSRQVPSLSARIRSTERQRWQAEFRLVWPDLRRVWQLALARRDAAHAALASLSLIPMWLDGSTRQAYDLVTPSIELADLVRPRHHGDMVFACAQAAYTLGDYERSGELLDRLGRDVELPSDPDLVAATTLLRGFFASERGDVDTCERELRRSVDLFEPQRDIGHAWYEGFAHSGLGWVLAIRGDVDGPIGEFAMGREVARASGNVGAEMQGLAFEGDMHVAVGRPASGRRAASCRSSPTATHRGSASRRGGSGQRCRLHRRDRAA
jgi:hypothetical protein